MPTSGTFEYLNRHHDVLSLLALTFQAQAVLSAAATAEPDTNVDASALSLSLSRGFD